MKEIFVGNTVKDCNLLDPDENICTPSFGRGMLSYEHSDAEG